MSTAGRVGIHVRSFPVPSEAFVLEQARSLLQFDPVLLVREQTSLCPLPIRAISQGSQMQWRRKLFALSPGAWAWGGVKELNDLQLLHAHFGPNGVYALPLSRRLDIPLVTTFHGFDATLNRANLLVDHGLFGMRYVLGIPALRRRGQLFVAVSEFLSTRLLAMGFPEQHVRRHYIGVDIERFLPLDPALRHPDIVCVARLTDAKGLGDLIRAFARIAPLHRQTRLRLIGAGPQRNNFARLGAELGLGEQLVFEGTMPHAEVAALVRRCSIGVLVSRRGHDGWQEAFGLAAIEAAAAGLPVLVTRHGGLTETVDPDRTGAIVAEGDVPAIADCLHQWLRQPGIAAQIGAAGRVRVERKFNLRAQTAILERLYMEVLQ